jgi:hypothetical protein
MVQLHCSTVYVVFEQRISATVVHCRPVHLQSQYPLWFDAAYAVEAPMYSAASTFEMQQSCYDVAVYCPSAIQDKRARRGVAQVCYASTSTCTAGQWQMSLSWQGFACVQDRVVMYTTGQHICRGDCSSARRTDALELDPQLQGDPIPALNC